MKKILNRNILFFSAVCVVMVAGCKSGDQASTDNNAAPATTSTTTTGTTPAPAATNTLVGSWDQDLGAAAKTAQGNTTNTFEFKDDGTFTGETTIDSPKTGKMTIDSEGKYTLDGDKYTETMSSMKATADTDAGKAAAEMINKTDLSKLPKYEGTAKWTDKDNVTITFSSPANQQPMVLKRKGGAAADDSAKSGSDSGAAAPAGGTTEGSATTTTGG